MGEEAAPVAYMDFFDGHGSFPIDAALAHFETFALEQLDDLYEATCPWELLVNSLIR